MIVGMGQADPAACAALPWYCDLPFSGFAFTSCLNAREICGTDLAQIGSGIARSAGQITGSAVGGLTESISPLTWIGIGLVGVFVLRSVMR